MNEAASPTTTRKSRSSGRRPIVATAAVLLLIFAAGAVYWWFRPGDVAVSRAEPPASGPKAEVAERLKATVFPVRAYRPDERNPDRVLIEYGSGVAAVRKGTILTAAHVARPGGRDARVVVLVGDRELPATVGPTKANTDVAVLSVPDYDGPFLTLAAGEPKADMAVSVVGFPVKFAGAALPRLIVTGGKIDDPALPSPLKDLHTGNVIRVAGATDLGGSGGAVVDADGALVGLVFGSRALGKETTHTYAVPASDLKSLIPAKADKP